MKNTSMKRQHLLAALILIVALAIYYRDVVFYGRTFLMETAVNGTLPSGPYNYQGVKPGWVVNDVGATAWFNEPYNKFISKSIKNGDFPLWNPYSGLAGAPLFADGQTAPLEPIQFLFFFAPLRYWPLSVDLQLLIRFFIGGFFCYLFARRLKINFLGSVTAGILFMIQGYLVSYGNHPQAKTETLLPLVLYGYDRTADAEDKPGVWICTLSIGWAIIAGMPEALFFSLFLGSLWYFYKIIFIKRCIGKIALVRYIQATSIGFILAAVYLFPLFELLSLAESAHQPGASFGYFGLLPVNRIPWLVIGSVETYPFRIGFIALFSLFFSFMNIKEWSDRQKEILFWGGYSCIFLVSMFDFPLNIIAKLPIFNQIVMYKYPFPSIHFSIAILIGIMIDQAGKSHFSNRKILIALLLVCGVIILPMIFAPAELKYFNNVTNKYSLIGLIIGMSLAVVCLNVFLKSYKKTLQIALIPIIFFEIFIASSLFTRPSRVYPFQSPPFVSFLRRDTSSFRIVALDAILFPNISTAYGIQDIRWVYGLIPRRLWDFSLQFIDPEQDKYFYYAGSTFPESVDMMNLLNVKYIISSSNIKDLQIRVAQPIQLDELYRRDGVNIYKNEKAFPRAFVMYDIINVDDFQSAMKQMKKTSFDPRKAAVVENFPAELATLINKHGQPIPFTTGEAKFVNSGQVDVTVKAEAPGLLVVSDQYYPGWTAYVDGESAPIYAVNGILRGVYLEEGRHVIQFKYRPRSFIIGAVISILLFLFVITMLVISRRRNDIVTETRNTFKPMELTNMKCTICGQEGANKEFSFKKYPVYSCANCGFRWLHPQPTDAELVEIYSDQYFLDEGDAKITEIVNQLKRSTANMYLEHLVKENHPPQAQLDLLEIGCGMGDFLLEAQSRGFKVSGLEVTDHLVELANRRLGTNSVHKGFLENSGFEDKAFDVIAFFDVIEHVRNPLEFMERVNRLLRKSGKIYIVTPSLDSWSAKLLNNRWMEYKIEHLSYFSRKSINILLEKSGFQNVRFYSNYKSLNFDYINRHFVRFPVKGISPMLNFIRKLTPDKLAYKPFKVVASGMAIIADKIENQ